MKLTRKEIQDLYETVPDADNVQRDENGDIVSFEFKRYYGTSKRTGKKIKVSIRSSKEQDKRGAVYLAEQPFFEQLADNIDCVLDVKLHAEKIYRYSLNGVKYKTDKTETKKLFDFLDYKDFKRVTNQRFYGRDDMLRNGYFSGLIGTHDGNISYYQRHRQDFALYDVDFNAAYPYCFKFPLPCGKFYSVKEWESVKTKFVSYTKFYQIKIKCIKNPFGVFIPPPPYWEYRDFDFLLQKQSADMVVSAERLSLIRQVYGNESFVIKKEWFCPTKIYLKFAKFVEWLYDEEKKKKNEGAFLESESLKIARNSLVGNFGRRDEMRSILGLKLIDNGFANDVIVISWGQPERKIQPNYLPLAMAVNDITARRLFNLLTDKNALRLCYNTDGGIVALRRGTRIATSNRMGFLKAKRIIDADFLYTTQLYNRPLVVDCSNNSVYNSKAIFFDDNTKNFVYSEIVHANTRRGFISFVNEYPVPVESYRGFNLRQSEVLLRVSETDLFKKMKRAGQNDDFTNDILKDAARSFESLCNPFDDLYCEIRHIPDDPDYYVEYTQQTMFNEKFFKGV